MYMIKAGIGNPRHPEYGSVTITFPIPETEYDKTVRLLSELEIGHAADRDCRIREIDSCATVLKKLEGSCVNVDDLDYLAKRLDSYEMAQFQAAASHYGFTDMMNLNNLTFCSQESTVISDFTYLDEVGRQHFLTVNGSVTSDMLERVDGQRVALDLISSGKGHVTPYGVFYENDMELRQVYDGMHLPPYLYQPCEAVLFISPQDRPEKSEVLYFPCPDIKIDRAMRRLDVDILQECKVTIDDCPRLRNTVQQVFDENGDLQENLESFRRLTEITSCMDQEQFEEFQTLLGLLRPQGPDDILSLAENFENISLEQNILSPEQLGWHCAEEHFNLDLDPENLFALYIDFEDYGADVAQRENGIFTELGYLTCSSDTPEMKALLARLSQKPEPVFDQDMGGM